MACAYPASASLPQKMLMNLDVADSVNSTADDVQLNTWKLLKLDMAFCLGRLDMAFCLGRSDTKTICLALSKQMVSVDASAQQYPNQADQLRPHCLPCIHLCQRASHLFSIAPRL